MLDSMHSSAGIVEMKGWPTMQARGSVMYILNAWSLDWPDRTLEEGICTSTKKTYAIESSRHKTARGTIVHLWKLSITFVV